jgi:hypothetical protein
VPGCIALLPLRKGRALAHAFFSLSRGREREKPDPIALPTRGERRL